MTKSKREGSNSEAPKEWRHLSDQEKVDRWLGATGYGVEAKTAQIISKRDGFTVTAPVNYLDLDGKTVKELDVFTAWRTDAQALRKDAELVRIQPYYFGQEEFRDFTARELVVSLQIECKYAKEPWVVFSSAASHASGKPMIDSIPASHKARSMLKALEAVPPETAPLMFNRGVLGTSLRQAKDNTDGKPANNTDDCYKAIMSALVSSKYEIVRLGDSQYRDEAQLRVMLPVIVINGAGLFNAYTDEEFTVHHEPVSWARLLYKLPNDMDRDLAVDVVHLNHLDDYLDEVETTCSAIASAFHAHVRDGLMKLARQRERNPHRR